MGGAASAYGCREAVSGAVMKRSFASTATLIRGTRPSLPLGDWREKRQVKWWCPRSSRRSLCMTIRRQRFLDSRQCNSQRLKGRGRPRAHVACSGAVVCHD
jgi:hypothetical protein